MHNREKKGRKGNKGNASTVIGNMMNANNAQRNENESQLDRLERKISELMIGMQIATARTERKLDALLASLAEEDGEPVAVTLDGEQAGGERDQDQPL